MQRTADERLDSIGAEWTAYIRGLGEQAAARKLAAQ